MKDQSTFSSKQYTIIRECYVALIKRQQSSTLDKFVSKVSREAKQ